MAIDLLEAKIGLFDLDGTLMPGDEFTDQALFLTAQLANQEIGVEPDTFVDLVRKHAKEIFYSPPFGIIPIITGAGARESLSSDFSGNDSAVASLRPIADEFLIGSWFRALAQFGYPNKEFARELSEAYRDIHPTLYHAYDGALETLDSLRSIHKMAIVTNGMEDVQRGKLRALGLDCYPHLISGEVGVGKPNLEIFRLALRKLSACPEETYMVGDNLRNDIFGSQQLGIFGIWKRNEQPDENIDQNTRPDQTISDISELKKIL